MSATQGFSCFLIGANSLLIECGDLLLREGHTIDGVIADTEKIARWARERDLRVIDSQSDYAQALRDAPFDYLFSITHLRIIPEAVLELPRRAAINFHDGPLPRYAGLNTPAWALINGETTYGISWHAMNAGVDSGDILKQTFFEIAAGETSISLNTKCFEAGIESFSELISELAQGSNRPTAQDPSQRSYFAKHRRPAAACSLDWTRPAAELEALVRALDFGRYPNPLGLAKLQRAQDFACVLSARALEGQNETDVQPGTVLAADADALLVATGDGVLSIEACSRPCGRVFPISELCDELGLEPGVVLEQLDETAAEALSESDKSWCKSERFWESRLAALETIELPYLANNPSATGGSYRSTILELPAHFFDDGPERRTRCVAVFCAFLSRVGQKQRFDVAYAGAELARSSSRHGPMYARSVPLRVELDVARDFASLEEQLMTELAQVDTRGSWLRDLVARSPLLSKRPELPGGELLLDVAIRELEGATDWQPEPGTLLALCFEESQAPRLWADGERFDEGALESFARQFANFARSLHEAPQLTVAEHSLLDAGERDQLLAGWNDTQLELPDELCVHRLFERQVERAPDATALAFEGRSLSYRELDQRAERLATQLLELGTGPDQLVGVFVERSLELVVSCIAIWKAGGAYLPLDPAYPRDRLAFMIADAGARVLLTQQALQAELPPHEAQVVCVDAELSAASSAKPSDQSRRAVRGDDLAYVIYTSGSTGKPKGVMVEHRNVVNFFAGMDQRIAHDPAGTWLAVTSLSFDISVLELFWTLTRGFEVVVHRASERDATAEGSGTAQASARPMDFGLFLWGNDDGDGPAKYRLLLEGARFADTHGFSSIWTPERHFHAFGGPYPNPSVTSAAIAAVTETVAIRAGSCVSPLHHPIRIAEEWGVVDNISNGRVGISFAAGWQPNDFVLRPENYPDNKACMFRDIDSVRRLWRGEALSFSGPLGEVERQSLPRPVQEELPVWVTTAGNPETYRQAGEIGANLLTHLLGQSIQEVAEKIAIYRAARAENGFDPVAGTVTLMLHTFIGEDDAEVRELVRGPMKSYLESSTNLVKQYAWSFPAFKRPDGEETTPADVDLESLTPEELDAMMEHAFERYFSTSGLFGTPETCLETVEELKAAGVDEIGCLIDYGIPTDEVLAMLPRLDRLRRISNPLPRIPNTEQSVDEQTDDYSIPALIRAHGVTHLQCTPSMGRMLYSDEEARAALAEVPHLMVGGEAFPMSLARDLRANARGTLTNMYGPTETTIWSSTQIVDGQGSSVPIGRPIANTQLYVLDSALQPVPSGVPGELYIGGLGVVRGYHAREELTAERFLSDPFRQPSSDGQTARMYRTGDLVRWRSDGVMEFLGRTDHQIKLRGYRIELGEIETRLGAHAGLREVVVVAREDTPGDQRLVAYCVPESGAPQDPELRQHLASALPEHMIPSHFCMLDALPTTPNGKVDRAALPAPDDFAASSRASFAAPENEFEVAIAQLWQSTLGREQVGVDDNFFDIGGHSLLVVRLHRALREIIEQPLSLTDLYRFPTIRALTEHLDKKGSDAGLKQSTDRAQKRRDSLERRRLRVRRGS